ncbi:MAG: 1,4-beta-xylanase [Clostridiales bacterium]|nr:1,4-beta-xylanase [Clostridiales bacterium]
MNFVKGFTFLLSRGRNSHGPGFSSQETKASLLQMKESTGCDTAVIAFEALQDTPQSEEINYKGPFIPTRDELLDLIAYAHSIGLRVFLKPMLNCKNGVWRAHINFFDLEVVCEPKWSKWFESYEKYLLFAAEIAESSGCECLIIGCEMVQTERKETYWRELIAQARKVYKGLLAYNTDKYQETEVKWWDALDVISSSGYYPFGKWEENLDRIEAVVKKFGLPFFFAECGCMCQKGCSVAPNDWTYKGELDLDEQARYFAEMFSACEKRDWVGGFVFWTWLSFAVNGTPGDAPEKNAGYGVFSKPSEKVIRQWYDSCPQA